jgi:hypothetical protein
MFNRFKLQLRARRVVLVLGRRTGSQSDAKLPNAIKTRRPAPDKATKKEKKHQQDDRKNHVPQEKRHFYERVICTPVFLDVIDE